MLYGFGYATARLSDTFVHIQIADKNRQNIWDLRNKIYFV